VIKTRTVVFAVLVLALVLSGVARAQEEQFLQYRTAKSPSQVTGTYVGRQTADVMTEAPKDVALPKFTGKPVFAKWTTPMVKAGFLWVAIDQSKEKGPHDRLYIDTNGDGSLADETAVTAWQSDRPGQPEGYEYVQFGPVKFVFKSDGGTVTYHLNAVFYSYKERTKLYLSPACWSEGTIKVAGKEHKCRLLDYNANGVFNDASVKPRESDVLELDVKDDGKFVQYFIGKYLQPEAGGPCFLLSPARDGASVTLAPAGDIPMGTVSVPKDTGFVELVGENGHFRCHASKGPVQVPAGAYWLKYIDLKRADDKGVRWEVLSSSASESLAVDVKAGGSTELAVGEPFVASLTVQKTGDGSFTFNQVLKGRGLEQVDLRRNEQQAPAPRVRIRNSDGSYDRLSTLEYG
jgi:hypothetical protein